MSTASLPDRSSENSTPIPDDNHEADLPLTMTASVVLTHLPHDATTALADAGSFAKDKVIVRFNAIGGAPILKKSTAQISSEQRFEAIVIYLRRCLRCGPTDSLILYINQSFAPALDEIVGNLHRCFQIKDQLVVSYSMTPAYG